MQFSRTFKPEVAPPPSAAVVTVARITADTAHTPKSLLQYLKVIPRLLFSRTSTSRPAAAADGKH